MAKLSQVSLSQVASSGLARINATTTVAEFLTAAQARINALTWVSEADVIAQRPVSGIIPQGGATANVLTGKDGLGKAHVSLRNQVCLGTKADGAAIMAALTGASASATLEQLREMYYAAIDAVSVQLTVWQDSEPKAWDAVRSGRSSFTAFLRADSRTGDVSLQGATPESVTNAIVIPTRRIETAMPDGDAVLTPPVTGPVMKSFAGGVHTVQALLDLGLPQATIDALPLPNA